MKPRLRFEEEVKTKREYLKGPLVTRPVKLGANVAIGYAHKKMFEVENDNVGTKAAHWGEMKAEAGLRKAYRHHKLKPYRRVEKLTAKTTKLNVKATYRKALNDNPALRKKLLARMMQKRRIKRQYAKAAREAQRAGKVGGKLLTKVAIKAKILAGKVVTKTAAVLANPKVLAIIGALVLMIILIFGLVSACSSMATGIGQSMVTMSYLAEDEDIDDAALYYSEPEVDMRLEILNAEENHPGYDEYRFDIGAIGHDPLVLMAYLTAVYHDFAFAEIQSVLDEIFATQYNLEFISEVEIRIRIEERTGSGSWTDEDGNSHSYTHTYTVEVEYEWWILNKEVY